MNNESVQEHTFLVYLIALYWKTGERDGKRGEKGEMKNCTNIPKSGLSPPLIYLRTCLLRINFNSKSIVSILLWLGLCFRSIVFSSWSVEGKWCRAKPQKPIFQRGSQARRYFSNFTWKSRKCTFVLCFRQGCIFYWEKFLTNNKKIYKLSTCTCKEKCRFLFFY